MDKTWIVAKSEYLRRVKSRGFILTTLLLPIAVVVFFFVVVLLSLSALEHDEARTIALVDQTGELGEALQAASDESVRFVVPDETGEALRAAVMDGRYAGYLMLPEGLIDGRGQAAYYSTEGGSTFLESRLRDYVKQVVDAERMQRANLDPAFIRSLQAYVPLRMVKLTEAGDEAGNTDLFIGLGVAMGTMIAMMMIIYGSVVMQGVIDEKTSRVVEVIVSSVRPFQLMLGKVLGIGAMGLTQVVIWSVLILGGSFAAGGVISLFLDPAQLNLSEAATTTEILQAADITIPSFPPVLFLWFAVYFVGGYLIYASLNAAIGSVVESQQDSQAFILPLLLPLILAMYTLVPQFESPNSALSIGLSLFPLTSPISAIVRMAVTDVPWWQTLLSLVFLIGGFFGVIWLAARIYRVGILMYGKKPGLRELIHWIRYA